MCPRMSVSQALALCIPHGIHVRLLESDCCDLKILTLNLWFSRVSYGFLGFRTQLTDLLYSTEGLFGLVLGQTTKGRLNRHGKSACRTAKGTDIQYPKMGWTECP